MHKRPKPLEIPDNRLYFTVALEGKGDHVFRTPRITIVAELLRFLPFSAIKDDATGLEMIDQLGRLFDPMCAVLGSCWHHEKMALDTKLTRDLEAYAPMVAEEFHAEGYSPSDVTALWAAVNSHLVRSLSNQQEAKEIAADFPQADTEPSRP